MKRSKKRDKKSYTLEMVRSSNNQERRGLSLDDNSGTHLKIERITSKVEVLKVNKEKKY